jgi:hypothetical protein
MTIAAARTTARPRIVGASRLSIDSMAPFLDGGNAVAPRARRRSHGYAASASSDGIGTAALSPPRHPGQEYLFRFGDILAAVRAGALLSLLPPVPLTHRLAPFVGPLLRRRLVLRLRRLGRWRRRDIHHGCDTGAYGGIADYVAVAIECDPPREVIDWFRPRPSASLATVEASSSS